MERSLEETILEKYETPKYTITLLNSISWDPSAAMYADQTDCNVYKISERIGLGFKMPHCDIMLNVIELNAEDYMYEGEWKNHSEEELFEISKVRTEKKWKKLSKYRSIFRTIFKEMAKDEFLDKIWDLYNTNQLPLFFYSSHDTFYEQRINWPKELQKKLSKIEKEQEKLEKELDQELTKSITTKSDSDLYLAEFLLDRISKYSAIHQKYIKKSEPLQKMVKEVKREISKNPKMSDKECDILVSKVRKIFKDKINNILKNQKLSEKQKIFWKTN